MENILKIHIEFLEMKTIMSEMKKKILEWNNSLLDIAEEKFGEFEYIAIEVIHNETQRVKRINNKKRK